jgi:DNA-binding MarR family transcriptional regulator
MTELPSLQAVRLKGRVTEAEVAATVREDPAAVARMIASLIDAGLLESGSRLKITAEGRKRLTDLLADERTGIDHVAIADAYNDFRAVNADFKTLVTEWQLKDGQPNNHDDRSYDAAVLKRLDDVHRAVTPIIAAAAEQIPRLAKYSEKLTTALQQISLGETTWFTRPNIDSYHTVWFELHEELIQAAGRNRADEASAGHAE